MASDINCSLTNSHFWLCKKHFYNQVLGAFYKKDKLATNFFDNEAEAK